MRSGAIALVAVLVAGLVAALVGAASAERPDVFSLGLDPVAPVNVAERGDEVCQAPIATPERFDRVALVLGPPNLDRGPFELTVRSSDGGRPTGTVLARAPIPRAPLRGEFTVALDRPVPAERDVAVCVLNRGAEPAELWGDDSPLRTPSTSAATDGRGRALRGDVYLRFPAASAPSLLERIPATFEHAAPFKLGGIGAWAFWVLAALVLLGAPALLARAVGAADDDGPDR